MEGYIWEIEKARAQDFNVEVYEEDKEVIIRGYIDVAVKIGGVIRSVSLRIDAIKNLDNWKE